MRYLKKLTKVFSILIVILILNLFVFICTIRIGAFKRVQVLLVTSTMTTLSHQYIAKIFATNEVIDIILKENRVECIDENSSKDIISILSDNLEKEKTNYDSEEGSLYLRFKPKPKINDVVELINISGDGYKGYILMVTNPKRIKMAATNTLNQSGNKLNAMISNNNGVAGINAGGFLDIEGVGNGGIPIGIIIEDGEIKYKDKLSNSYSIIGFDKDGVLLLGNYTLEDIRKLEIVQAVSFNPFLIVNGKPLNIYGDGGWGINPRTAIGQKPDGTVIMVVIDGRQVSSVGITIKELQNIMIRYGAVNAANLDGGSSTVMYYEGKLINKPCSPYGERPLPSAFIVKSE